MSAVTIQQMADRVAQLMEERVSVRGRDLSAKLRKVGRLLPRRVRAAAGRLAVAAQQAQNPKLLGQIEMGDVSEAYDLCVRHLMTVDPTRSRRDYYADVLGSVGYGILVAALLVVGFLAWRSYF